MAELLDEQQLSTAMARLTGWSGDRTGLRRTVQAPDFPTAIRIVDDVAAAAEAMQHHPDIDIRWRTLHFMVVTHDAGGVTDLDLRLASRINELAGAHDAS